jgi:hypothetical protein
MVGFDQRMTIMDGHASDAPEDGGLVDLASFLDTPEEESTQETEAQNPADEATAEDGDTAEDAIDGQDEADAEPSEDDDAEAEKDTEPAPDRKVKVTLKNEDGTEVTEEVPETELVKGYQRQADYTRKTQALAERESQAVEFLKTKHDEVRSHYLQQAEVTRAAVVQMAGIKTEAEMAQLANTDPAQWVAESQRQQAISKYLQQLDTQIATERQAAEQEAAQRQQMAAKQLYERAWGELQKDGIDKPALAKIYGEANKVYGFTPEELGQVYDPRLVRMMKDAAAYQALKSQKAEVTKKVAAAPRLPTRQASPAQDRRDQALENKFRSGKAKLNDLAALLR